MAAFSYVLLRACSRCKILILPSSPGINKLQLLGKSCQRYLTVPPPSAQSTDSTGKNSNYPLEFEVSYDEFKHVLPLLPKEIVPELPQHASYPTSSGWFPPNLELRSKQKYLVRRTKNHMLPVYSETRRKRIDHIVTFQHYVIIRKIEGDIWALEAELKTFLMQKKGLKQIKTQVHEVGRFIKIRGMHADLVADYLFKHGM